MSHIGEFNNNNRPVIRFEMPHYFHDIAIIVFSIMAIIGYALVAKYPKIFFKNAIPSTGLTRKFWLVGIPFIGGITGVIMITIGKICTIYRTRILNTSVTEHAHKERMKLFKNILEENGYDVIEKNKRLESCKEFLESNGHRVIIQET